MPTSSSKRRASERGASPTSRAMSSNRTSSASRSLVMTSARRSSCDCPAGTVTGLGCCASLHATAARAPNTLRAYGGSGCAASGQSTHSDTRARARGLRSNTVSGAGGSGAKRGWNRTDDVLTGWGMATWMGSPAAMSAARAGGSSHDLPCASSRSGPLGGAEQVVAFDAELGRWGRREVTSERERLAGRRLPHSCSP